MDAPTVATVVCLLWGAAQYKGRSDEKPKTDAEKLAAYYAGRGRHKRKKHR
jgi:hypothetical protein